VNKLTILDVSNNTALIMFGCAENQLTSLDVSNNTALKGLNCSVNRLTSLDVSNNTALHLLFLVSMPSLSKVCVWTMPFPPADVTVDTTGSPNLYFTTNCN
jgi:Leucine-rich repeat (LRR) protein